MVCLCPVRCLLCCHHYRDCSGGAVFPAQEESGQREGEKQTALHSQHQMITLSNVHKSVAIKQITDVVLVLLLQRVYFEAALPIAPSGCSLRRCPVPLRPLLDIALLLELHVVLGVYCLLDCPGVLAALVLREVLLAHEVRRLEDGGLQGEPVHAGGRGREQRLLFREEDGQHVDHEDQDHEEYHVRPPVALVIVGARPGPPHVEGKPMLVLSVLLKMVILVTMLPRHAPSEKRPEYLLELVLLCVALPVLPLWTVLWFPVFLGSVPVIACFLFWVDQSRVCIAYFLKYLFGPLGVIFVGVEPQCQFLIGLLNFGLVTILRHSKDIVVVLLPKIHCNLFLHFLLLLIVGSHAFKSIDNQYMNVMCQIIN